MLVLVMAACSQVSQTPPSETPSEESPLVSLTLSNGNGLEFFAGADDTENILVLEAVKQGSTSALSLLSEKGMTLDQLTPHDIFWAFAKPGTPMPSVLKNENMTQQRIQGWASELLAKPPENTTLAAQAVDIACNNGPFLQNYISLGQPQGGNQFLALDKTPAGGSPFTAYVEPGLPNVRYKFERTTVFNTKWYGSICGRSVQNSTNNHYVGFTYYGPYMTFEYSKNGSVWTQSIYTPKVIPANGVHWHNYIWFGSNQKRITVKRVLPADQFDLANVSNGFGF
jgi:hypothetical protein